MANNSMEADTAPERNVASPSDNTKPLVSNEDMSNYSVTITPRIMNDHMSVQSKELPSLDFGQHPISGYDACEPSHKPMDGSGRAPELTPKGEAYLGAARDALTSPERPAPNDLSDENKRNVDSIAKGAAEFDKGIVRDFGSDDFAEKFKKHENDLTELQESLNKVPSKDMEDVLAGVNEKLKSQGLRIEQVPGTKEIWMGKKEDATGSHYLHTRLREANCHVS